MSPELEAAVNLGSAAAHVGGALDGLRQVDAQTDPLSRASDDIALAIVAIEKEYDRLTGLFMKARARLPKVTA